MLPHKQHAGFQLLAGRDGQRIRGHHIAHAGAACVATFDDNFFHQVALGEDADQQPVFQDRDSSNVAVNHSLGHIKNGLIDVRAVGILVTDQVVDTTHLAPPSDPVGRAAAPPAVGERRPPAAKYMPKSDAGKEPKYCNRAGCPMWRRASA